MIEIVEHEGVEVMLVVRYHDRVERLGPSRRDFAELAAEQLRDDHPDGFISAVIREV